MNDVRVLVSDNFAFASDAIAIAVILDHGPHNHQSVMRISEAGFTSWEEVDPSVAGAHPTMTLNNDVARALLDALLRHYQGAEDMRTVRGDLLHERGRVDKMIMYLGELSSKVIDLADTAVTQ